MMVTTSDDSMTDTTMERCLCHGTRVHAHTHMTPFVLACQTSEMARTVESTKLQAAAAATHVLTRACCNIIAAHALGPPLRPLRLGAAVLRAPLVRARRVGS
jgi:hypothetical protein